MTSRYPVMICTRARGGMRSVVEAYTKDGLLGAWRFKLLWTHEEGGIGRRLSIALKAALDLLGCLVRREISFMHVHVAMWGSFWRKSLFVVMARLFGVPSIIHLHGSELKQFYASLSAFGRFCFANVLERASVVIVLSDSWKAFIQTVAPKAKIRVINNYVNVPLVTRNYSTEGRVSVLFLGALGKRKGVYDLLEAWRSVVAVVPNARLLLGGNGEIDQARRLIDQLKISDSVQLLGWVQGDQKLELLANADVFVLPSHNEGLPMSVLEAMSWGLPVVTTRVGGIPELVTHGRDGLLIDSGDVLALSTSLIDLISSSERRELLGSAAKQRVLDGFSDKAILPKIEELYIDFAR